VRTYQHLVVVGRPGVDRLANARYALEANQNEAAYAHAADALGANQSERYLIMARALARLGRFSEAESLYRTGIDFDALPEAAAEFGILLVAMNEPGKARAYLEHAVAALPEHHRARGALGLVALQSGEPEVAFPLVTGFNTSTRQAEQGVERLRAAADGAGRQIARQSEAATALKDDLAFLTERGEKLADRLDGLVRSARPLTHEPQGQAPAMAMASAERPEAGETRLRSQAERDLLKALRMAR